MFNAESSKRIRIFGFIVLFILSIIAECIPQEAEARAFGRRRGGGGGRRVNQARGQVRRNNAGQVRRNNDIFNLDQEPVNVFSSLAIDPFGAFGQIQQLQGFNNIFTNGQGRFFTGTNNLGNIALQAELLRAASGTSFFGSVGLANAAFNPSVSSETFNQIQFLNTLGSLSTSCRGGFCSIR